MYTKYINLCSLAARDMDPLIWYIIMIPCCILFSGIGIYAWNRKKPMWFWAGTTVDEAELSDVTAYNHANGLLWGIYSLIFWAATLAGVWSNILALILIAAGCVIGLPLLVVFYRRIYKKYKKVS